MKISTLVSFAIVSLFLSSFSDACQKTVSDFKGFASVTEYKSNKPKTQTIAVILPPTGGESAADRGFAEKICRSGVSSVIFDYTQRPVGALETQGHDRVSLEFLNYFREFLIQQAKPSVVVGASLGGLYSSMSFGSSLPNLQGAVLIVAGGSLAEILATSDLESVKAQRAARLTELKFNTESDYQAFMEEQIEFDPVRLANKSLSNKILFLGSSKDTIVPTKTQEQLWEAWGRPRKVMKPLGHVLSGGYYYFFMTSEIADFIVSLPSTN